MSKLSRHDGGMKLCCKILFLTVVTIFASYISAIAVHAGEVLSIKFIPSDSEIRMEIHTQGLAAPEIFALSGEKPRLVVDFKDAVLSADLRRAFKSGEFRGLRGGILGIRAAAHSKADPSKANLRLVADLALTSEHKTHGFDDKTVSVVFAVPSKPRRFDGVPYPRKKPFAAPRRTIVAASASQSLASTSQDINVVKAVMLSTPADNTNIIGIPSPRLRPSRAFKPVIVIDPGHGGHDPGAIGKKGTYEAGITLKAAKELRRQLLKSGRYKVVLTRMDNTYVEHSDRILIARKAGANLFISIHADSTAKSTTRGASVYTLADRAKSRSKRIVNKQNWISDVDLASHSASVGDILVDLAQRKTRSESGRFANILIPQLKSRTTLLGNSHREAGYYVLLAPDVPAVLLEMGFISNANDETNLRTAAHRRKLMTGVTNAINMYFDTQTP